VKKIRHMAYLGSIFAPFGGSSEPYPVLSEKGLGRFTGLRTLKIHIRSPICFEQDWAKKYQQRVEGYLESVWANMRELDVINPLMAGQECQVQWVTRDEWNLAVTDTGEFI
jgi:hypothetical protein